MNRRRLDLSDWIIHFVHVRQTKDVPEWYDTESGLCHLPMPDYFDSEGKPHTFYEEPYQDNFALYGEASAFQVLCKIINDGFLKTGWAFRDHRATIYGPMSAVCFTEMPLYALADYVRSRSASGYVGRYGIAFRREELFRAGARPVINGLTGKHEEATMGDVNYGCGFRTLSCNTGIGLYEQYRYVYTNLSKNCDWTFEREWRWPLPGDTFNVAGLPFLLEECWDNPFSEIIIIVSTDTEAHEMCNLLRNVYESVSNNYGVYYHLPIIEKTKVISLEYLEKHYPDPSKMKIDNLSFRYMAKMAHIEVQPKTLERVKAEIRNAGFAAQHAIEDYLKVHPESADGGLFGFAWVYTYDYTEITQALLDLNVADTNSNGCYRLYLNDYMKTFMIDLLEKGAQAAADYLTRTFHQEFYMGSRLD